MTQVNMKTFFLLSCEKLITSENIFAAKQEEKSVGMIEKTHYKIDEKFIDNINTIRPGYLDSLGTVIRTVGPHNGFSG